MTNFEMKKKTEKELREFLESHKLYHPVYCDADSYVVDISWGDWKHDHIVVERLVTKWFEQQGRIVTHSHQTTEMDGSDTYSAVHYFKEVL